MYKNIRELWCQEEELKQSKVPGKNPFSRKFCEKLMCLSFTNYRYVEFYSPYQGAVLLMFTHPLFKALGLDWLRQSELRMFIGQLMLGLVAVTAVKMTSNHDEDQQQEGPNDKTE